MNYEQKEIELARRYMQGELTDTQFNFLVVQNKFEKKKIEELLDQLHYYEPICMVAKLALLYIFLCFAVSFFISLFQFLN